MKETLKQLEAESKIQAVDITDGPVGKGQRYIHSQEIPLLGDLDSDTWEPRVSLLSPFDNLFCDRARTKLVFNFDYTIEIYTPRSKRKYGYYVLPILYGDEFIGRVDPLMDRKNEKLLIKAVYVEPHARKGKDVSREIWDSVEQLSEFLGAKDVVYPARVRCFGRAIFTRTKISAPTGLGPLNYRISIFSDFVITRPFVT